MKRKQEYHFKKRKRLERDYNEYSKDNIPHTLNREYAIKYARNFHDRAITCIDLANIYWLNGYNHAALVYVESGIEDLKKSINIYIKLRSGTHETRKCAEYIGIFKKNIQIIEEKIKGSAVYEDVPKHESEASSPLRKTIFRAPRCSPLKSKEIKGECGSLEINLLTDNRLPSILDFN